MKKAVIFALALILICGACGKSGGETPDETPDPDEGMEQDDTDWTGEVEYDGVKYRRRTDFKTVLFLGVDNTKTSEFDEDVVGNNGRSDAIMLFLVDTKDKTSQLLTISRDTITEVDVYTGDGDLVYSRPMQVTLQYSYGDSPKRSCFLAQRTISELLYDARIDGYFSLTMDGIPVIVDELGGITLTMPEDYTQIDSRYTKGATVTLDGEEAESFIRYRDLDTVGSNEDRNERQSWFVTEMFRQMRGTADLQETVERMLEVAEPYIETDVDAETLKLLASSTLEETYKVPGEVRQGQFHNEYYVDEEALRELVLQLFYRPVE